MGFLGLEGPAEERISRRTFGRPSGSVVVIGDIMVDIAVKPRGDVRFGSDTPSDIRLGVGGTGANTAIHLARLGADVLLLGRVGDDDLGHFVAGRLEREGVVLPRAPMEGVATGAIGILVDGTGQRTMFPQQGANEGLDARFVGAFWPRGTDSIGALFVSAYALFRESSREGTLWAMDEARAAGVPVFVDPASYAFIEDVGPEQFLRWTGGTTVLLPNREEAAVLAAAVAGPPDGFANGVTDGAADGATDETAGGNGPGGSPARLTLDGARRAAAVLGTAFPVVVVTLDGDGAVFRSGNEKGHVPGVQVPVVDTTGAGDAFNAAFIAAYVKGKSVVEAVKAGHRLAARVVQRIGPT